MSVRRASSLVARVPGVAWLLLLTAGLLAAYGHGYAHYDALYSVVWGHDLLHGHLPPDLGDVHSPTEHPLANAIGALLSLLGFGALATLNAISLASFAALGVLAFRLGRALFGASVGLGFAVLLLTTPALVTQTLMSSIDIPYLVLVLWAAVLEAERPRRGLQVLLVLAICGLLRPEAWLLAGAYLIYLAPRLERRALLGLTVLAALSPVAWLLFDWAAANDALISLHGTQRAGIQTRAPHSLLAAVRDGPGEMASVLGRSVVVVGVIGLGVSLAALRERSRLPAVLLGLGLLGFLALGAANLPVISRYLFIPALMLGLFCAVGLFGWTAVGRDFRGRGLWRAAAPLLLVAILIGNAHFYTHRLTATADASGLISDDDAVLHAMLDKPRVQAVVRSCHPLQVRDFRAKPLLAYLLGGHARDYVQLAPDQAAAPGTYLEHVTVRGRVALPPQFRVVADARRWILFADCPPNPGL